MWVNACYGLNCVSSQICMLNSQLPLPPPLQPLQTRSLIGKRKSLAWVLIQYNWCLCKKEEIYVGTQQVAVDRLREEGTNPAGTLILAFQAPGLWGHKQLLFKPPSAWPFMPAAPGRSCDALRRTGVGQLDTVSW